MRYVAYTRLPVFFLKPVFYTRFFEKMSTSCYAVPGFTYFRNLVCLMLITWMPTKVLSLFKCILHLGPRVTLIRHCLTQWVNPV